MRLTVDFDDEFDFVAVEVGNRWADRMLAAEFQPGQAAVTQ